MNLQDIPLELIRQNWSSYKNIIQTDDPYYTFIWNDFEKKLQFNITDHHYQILKNFIIDSNFNPKDDNPKDDFLVKENQTTLIFKVPEVSKRKKLHQLCDKLGLHHEMKFDYTKYSKKLFYISKQENWSWEFSEANPSSIPYEKCEQMNKIIREDRLRKKLSSKYCCICDNNGYTTQLYKSIHVDELYCETCLKSEDNEECGKYSDYNFEPIWRG